MFKIIFLALCFFNFLNVQSSSDVCTSTDYALQQYTSKTVTYGACRNTQPVANFNAMGIAGKWYLYQMYNFASAMQNLTCSIDSFVPAGNALNYTGYFIYQNGSVVELIKNQFPLDQFKTGELKVPAIGLDLKVVDTDYNNYILWQACYTDLSTNAQYQRIVVSTRYMGDVSAQQDAFFDQLIAAKIFDNYNPISIPPYGRCNCSKL